MNNNTLNQKIWVYYKFNYTHGIFMVGKNFNDKNICLKENFWKLLLPFCHHFLSESRKQTHIFNGLA